MNKKIGIFGGSFNPPTSSGHLRLTEKLIKYNYVDEVWILPCYNSLHTKSLINDNHRINMLNILINKSEYKNNIFVCDYEIKNKMSGKTIDVINNMLPYYRKNGYSNAEFKFIIGMDNALLIHKFVDYDKVIESVPFIVMPRHNYIPSEDEWFMYEPHIYAKDVSVQEIISSTLIRTAMKNIKVDGLPSTFFNWIDYEIFQYIITNNLYIKEQ